MLCPDPLVVRRIRRFLDDLAYDTVQRSLRPYYFTWPFPPLERFRKLLPHLPERQRLGYEVLMLGQPAMRTHLAALWGADVVDDLEHVGLLVPASQAAMRRTDNFSIVSFLGRYFVVSITPYYPTSRDPDASVYIGPDSLVLAASVAANCCQGRCLDLCTGSGIQAIMLATTAHEVIATDISPLAVTAAQFNAVLNGVEERVTVLQSNLYECVPPGPYDRIVANPPFLPVPDGVHHSPVGYGGEDGMAILTPLLRGIPERLAADGDALVYAEGVGDQDGPLVRRLLAHLCQGAGMDAQIVLVARLTIKSALVLKAASLVQLRRPATELRLWQDLYQRLGATHTYQYLLRMRHGKGRLEQIVAFDPHREDQGIELPSGTVVKPR